MTQPEGFVQSKPLNMVFKLENLFIGSNKHLLDGTFV